MEIFDLDADDEGNVSFVSAAKQFNGELNLFNGNGLPVSGRATGVARA
ncbi:hypothetical protein [Bosea sp. (in: a-proteobacteria)]|nr:hypothetical protein [Bosea sp. (in: a-proteobacteria)]WRH56736.1 MAG: hypothetical protein RSE11_17050 [Bosea sp. (in: a-proteobacteria)]